MIACRYRQKGNFLLGMSAWINRQKALKLEPLTRILPKLTFTRMNNGNPFKLIGICALIFLCLTSFYGHAQTDAYIHQFLPKFQPQELHPDATGFGDMPEEIPVIPLMNNDELVGYAFVTTDFTNTTGYSGKPIHILASIDIEGRLNRIELVKHSEPIVLVGIPDSRIKAVLKTFESINVVELIEEELSQPEVDIISGATVTIMVMDDSLINAAKKIARQLLMDADAQDSQARQLRDDITVTGSWEEQQTNQLVAHLNLTVEQVNQNYLAHDEPVAAQQIEDGFEGEDFIDLYLAPASIPALGRYLLGEGEYKNLLNRLDDNQQAILVMASGRYSFRGSGFVRGGIFDRVLVRQGDDAIRFRDLNYKRINKLAPEDAPLFDEIALFIVPKDAQLNLAEPWQLELLVGRATGSTSKAFLTYPLPYQIAESYLLPRVEKVVEAETPLWQKLWIQKQGMIAVLGIALLVLSCAFYLQHWLTIRPLLTERFRIGFLIFTLVVVGWYGNAQLSVVNILTVFHAWVYGFDWAYFLMEPLIFILWGSVAFALIFWGRGAFCGWLCPFGALQELSNRVAKLIHIPQIKVPWLLHERLWAIKYIIFIVLFGVALHSIELAERLAEVEPFKTAIILKFDRPWPYVLFALGMLLPGLFIERFYCRYFCPLGAALAIPSRMRIFEWLKRYKECGTECQRCAKECMVQSIHPEGHINVNECLYCMHCQVLYLDQDRCYKHIKRQKKRQKQLRGKKAAPTEVIATDASAN
ncbi:MAG: 4Fe-4S binding protein [Cellvibrionaceae bacterium]|nr:4Fe-4S binding protein [Cellvibrionaceae bacterium]|tara:strand:+ start:1151 stop:3418 length:2268 start_codon:yes stop_codon:yes gene_type:complete